MSLLLGAIARKSLYLANRYAQSFSEGIQTALVVITRAGGYNRASGEYDPSDVTVIYDDDTTPGVGGQAGITNSTGPVTMMFGDEPAYFDSFTVFLPRLIPNRPKIDDIVLVITHQDPDLVGRYLRVVGVESGGRIVPSTQLQCVGVAPSKQWGTP